MVRTFRKPHPNNNAVRKNIRIKKCQPNAFAKHTFSNRIREVRDNRELELELVLVVISCWLSYLAVLELRYLLCYVYTYMDRTFQK